MGVSKVTFASAGKISQHSHPGAYSRNESLQRATGNVSANNAVLVGMAQGGKPNTLTWCNDFAEAGYLLKGGDLLDAMKIAFNPGAEVVPQRIAFMRVNPAVQGSAVLKVGLVDTITLKTADYGNLTNQTQYKLTAGTTAGKKFAEKYRDQEYTYDNIRRQSFTVRYIGAGTAATMTVDATGITTTVTGGPGGENLTMTFASFPDVQSIVAYFNAHAGYTAAAVGGQELAKGSELDAATAVDIATATYTANSDVQALVDTINGSKYFVATLVGGAPRTTPDNVLTYQFVTGGTDGVTTTTEWQNALALLEREDIQLVGTIAENDAIVSLLSAHVNACNSVTGKTERQGVAAGGTQTLAGAKTLAAQTNNSAMQIVYFRGQGFNAANESVVQTSKMFVAQQIGQKAGLDLNNPTTFKAATFLDVLYTDCSTLAQIEDAIENGVTVIEKTLAGVIRTVRDISSYQANDLKLNENCMVRQMLFIARDLRTGAESFFIGNPGNGTVYNKIRYYCSNKLDSYVNSGYLVGGASGPAWRDFSLVVEGDVVRIVWTGNVSAPVNFIFITNKFDIFVAAA